MKPHRMVPAASAALIAMLATSGAAGTVSPPAEWGSIHLTWDACPGDGAVSNKSFACNTNLGSATLVISVTPPVAIPQFNGFQATVFAMSVGAMVPVWWQAQSGGCRAGAAGFSFTPPAGSAGCEDPWQGLGIGGINYSYPSTYYGWSNVVRLRAVGALSSGTSSLEAGQNYFLIRLTISYNASTGPGSCSDCSAGFCLGLGYIQLTQPLGAGDLYLHTPQYDTDSDYATWQPGVTMLREWYGGVGGPFKSFQCIETTNTRQPTWGALKRLYAR